MSQAKPTITFSTQQRERLRQSLIDRARDDPRITSAAITGSVAIGTEDRWSDIDLAFGVDLATDPADVLSDWSHHMMNDHHAVDQLDVTHGAWVYRVFLLANTLQVDLAFAPVNEFGAMAESFQLIFGAAKELEYPSPPPEAHFVGWAWLYALHFRSSLRRGHLWQALSMFEGLRTQVLALACLRHDLPTSEARGWDRLPPDVTEPFAQSMVGALQATELAQAFAIGVDRLLCEARHFNEALADRLAGPLEALVHDVNPKG